MSSNLPPGVTESMLPGNRPDDLWWDIFYESLDESGVWSITEILSPQAAAKHVSNLFQAFSEACDAGIQAGKQEAQIEESSRMAEAYEESQELTTFKGTDE